MVENDVKCGLHFHWCEIKATSCHNLLFTVIIQSCAAKQGMKIWLWEIPEKKKKNRTLSVLSPPGRRIYKAVSKYNRFHVWHLTLKTSFSFHKNNSSCCRVAAVRFQKDVWREWTDKVKKTRVKSLLCLWIVKIWYRFTLTFHQCLTAGPQG